MWESVRRGLDGETDARSPLCPDDCTSWPSNRRHLGIVEGDDLLPLSVHTTRRLVAMPLARRVVRKMVGDGET